MKATVNEVVVKSCNNCIFRQSEYYPRTYDYSYHCGLHANKRGIDESEGLVGNISKFPEWCPLEKAQVLVKREVK